MDRPAKPVITAVFVPLLAGWLFALPGCGDDKPSFEVLSLEGRVEEVDLKGGTVSVEYYNEKKKENVIGTGQVTDETEIMINGVLATLADLRVGDRVAGQVRVEKKGQAQTQIAMKIHVTRPKPVGGD